MCKGKVTLTLNRLAYDLYILDFSIVLLCKFHYDYIKTKCCVNSRLLFTDTDSLMYVMKSKDIHEDFSKYEGILGISLLSQNMIIQVNYLLVR